MCATLFSGFFYLLSSPSPAVLSLTCPLPLKLITENFILIVLFFHQVMDPCEYYAAHPPPNDHRSRFPHPHPLSPSLRAYPAPSTKTAADKKPLRTPRNTKISTNVFTFSLPVPVPVPFL